MEDPNSVICVECETSEGQLTKCSGSCARWFHNECAGVVDADNWKCPDCTYHVHRCFACKEYDYDNNLVACSEMQCRRRFHIDDKSGCQSASTSEDFVCPRHACHATACKFSSICDEISLSSCFRCSASYHVACQPPDVRMLTARYFVCGSHEDAEDLPPVRDDILDYIRAHASKAEPRGASSSPHSIHEAAEELAASESSASHAQARDPNELSEEGLVYISYDELQALFRQEITLFETHNDVLQARCTPASTEPPLCTEYISLEADTTPQTVPGPPYTVFALHPAELLQNPAEVIAHLYPRFRCKVCDARFHAEQNLRTHINEHRNLAMVLGTAPAHQTPDLLREQWFDQLRFKLPGLSTVGQVQDRSMDIRKPTGQHCRSWAIANTWS
jgi:hypothetical protein